MKRLLLSLLCVTQLKAMEVVPSSAKEENLRVLHDTQKQRMYVEDENAAWRIENYDMDALMRSLVIRGTVGKFTENDGYVRINKNSEGKYELLAKVRGRGGTGPLTACTVGLLVRVGCYTGYLFAASTPVVVGTATTGPGGGIAAAAAVQLAVAGAGGLPAIIASTEATANAATLWTLALPFPLP